MQVARPVECLPVFENHVERGRLFEDEAINIAVKGGGDDITADFALENLGAVGVILDAPLSVSSCSTNVLGTISKHRKVFNICWVSGEHCAWPGGKV